MTEFNVGDKFRADDGEVGTIQKVLEGGRVLVRWDINGARMVYRTEMLGDWQKISGKSLPSASSEYKVGESCVVPVGRFKGKRGNIVNVTPTHIEVVLVMGGNHLRFPIPVTEKKDLPSDSSSESTPFRKGWSDKVQEFVRKTIQQVSAGTISEDEAISQLERNLGTTRQEAEGLLNQGFDQLRGSRSPFGKGLLAQRQGKTMSANPYSKGLETLPTELVEWEKGFLSGDKVKHGKGIGDFPTMMEHNNHTYGRTGKQGYSTATDLPSAEYESVEQPGMRVWMDANGNIVED